MFRKVDTIEDSEGDGTRLWHIDEWNTEESSIGSKNRDTIRTTRIRDRVWKVEPNRLQPNLTWPKRRCQRRYEALLIIGILEIRYVVG